MIDPVRVKLFFLCIYVSPFLKQIGIAHCLLRSFERFSSFWIVTRNENTMGYMKLGKLRHVTHCWCCHIDYRSTEVTG